MVRTIAGENKTATITLVVINCAHCGTPFGIEENLHRGLRRTKDCTFYCPNGHSLTFGHTEIDELKAQLTREERRIEALETRAKHAESRAGLAERRRRAAKGQLTKLQNRIANGRCPCCDAVFPDLLEHMKAAHPDYEAQEAEETPGAEKEESPE